MNASTRPLLILDIDETLIFGAEAELDCAANFRVGPFHVYERPWLADFLAEVARWYELAIWSSATADYVGQIASRICPNNAAWRFVWARERCTQRTNFESSEIEYIKDLKKVKRQGFALERVIMVDDSPVKASRNFGNAIYVAPYTGAASDAELPLLARYLESIRDAQNFRDVEKRGWCGVAAKL
jgi:RNA polymerase II subunit A small phosphatase-like protein